MAKIVVDCDLVLAASDTAWLGWLEQVSKPNSDTFNRMFESTELDYDLSSYYSDELKSKGRDGYDFWRSRVCYDYVMPVEGSVEAIKKLKEGGHNIAVVSAIKGNHSKSKYQFLQRYYPNCIDAFIWTQEKGWVDCDYFIDDRNKFLNTSKAKVATIKYDTIYTQCEELKIACNVAKDWDTIYTLIKQYEESK